MLNYFGQNDSKFFRFSRNERGGQSPVAWTDISMVAKRRKAFDRVGRRVFIKMIKMI